MDFSNLRLEINAIITKELPNLWYSTSEHKQYLGSDKYLKIQIALCSFNINGVLGQKPCIVSLILHNTLDLHPQIFGDNGGNRIYRKVDKTIEREKYLALGREIVPFKAVKHNEKAVLSAIRRFCVAYRGVLVNTYNRGLLKHEGMQDESIKLLINNLISLSK